MDNKQSSVEWLISQLQKSKDWHRVLNEISQMSSARVDIIEQAKQMEQERMQEQYQDGREIGKIEILTTQSTNNAGAYSEGYKKGYLAALEYMNRTIENKIKVRQ
jgi:flagellar biosynthesis/type III secretory pathway protein FliH